MTKNETNKEKITVINKQTKIQSPKPTCKYCKKGPSDTELLNIANAQQQKKIERKERETSNKKMLKFLQYSFQKTGK